MGSKSRMTYTSKGQRRNVAKSTLKLVNDAKTGFEKHAGILLAWERGLNPWVTVKNEAQESNRLFYKVRANDVMGNPKRRSANLFNRKGDADE